MSTPSTDELRYAYFDYRVSDDQVRRVFLEDADVEYSKEFDRWLASVKAEAVAIAVAERDALDAQITAVESLHKRLDGKQECGAELTDVVKHSSSGTRLSIIHCTLTKGHAGDHKDESCCWNFHRFDQVELYNPREFSGSCASCKTSWPCATIRALEESGQYD